MGKGLEQSLASEQEGHHLYNHAGKQGGSWQEHSTRDLGPNLAFLSY